MSSSGVTYPDGFGMCCGSGTCTGGESGFDGPSPETNCNSPVVLDVAGDGVSQPGELHALPSLDVARRHLDYKDSKRADEHGNRFGYRARLDDAKGVKAGRRAWDVFLVAAP